MKELRIPAIEVRQSPGRVLYTFGVDGKLIDRFAAITRVHREAGVLGGYQRPEVLSHISEIRNYLESESPMIPNALVIAFDHSVRFEAGGGGGGGAYAHAGMLVIPMRDDVEDEEKPGFVVDGQQRLAAIREAALEHFPICVTAFITSGVREQIEQFILVNSTKPLPKGLIYELLPGTQTALPSLLRRRRFPAQLLERLNGDEDSPLRGLIQTPTNPAGLVKDNSILKMLENSLSDGVLYRFRSSSSDDGDAEAMLRVLKAFWGAVADRFPDAWAVPPKRSRLMHGAGIVSMGFVMDAIADRRRANGIPDREMFGADLEPLRSVCRWCEGYWELGPGRQRRWNEVQNTSKDIAVLSNFLLHHYKRLVWDGQGEEAPVAQAALPLRVSP